MARNIKKGSLTITYSGLTEEMITILVEASKTDDGRLRARLVNDLGISLSTSTRWDVYRNGRTREDEKWKDAFEALVSKKLLRFGYTNNYELTNRGWEIAEALTGSGSTGNKIKRDMGF